MGRMAGCCSRASALASWRKRASIPGVQAISGCSTLQASRRSRSLSHSSYTSAKPPRPTSRRTSYLSPSARARRCAVGTPASAAAGAAAVGSRTTRSFVITVGDGVPQDGQNAEPEGMAARHEGQVSWVVTAPKICIRGARCKLSSAYARAAHRGGRGARIRVDRAARLVAPGAARVSRPTRPRAGSAPTGDLAPRAADALHHPAPPSPALLWFYGNGENIAEIWPILRDFQPPGTALLVVDYPGYGGSEGRATEAGLYAAAEAAYAALAGRAGVDAHRIHVYGRSLGTAVASYTAARHPVAGLILESPFTSAAAMARHLYPFLPRLGLRLSLDNLGHVRLVRCPVLLLHGTADRLAPTAMGMAVAAAAASPVEVVLIHGAGHNDTYEVGGREYRDKVWAFVGRP